MKTDAYHFRVIAGPATGRRFSIGSQGALIGRSEHCDIILIDPSLSRHHCRIFLRDGLLWVIDLQSANGTEVDGKPVREAPLWKNRRIVMGDTVMLVESDAGGPVPHKRATGSDDTTISGLWGRARQCPLAQGISSLVRKISTGHDPQAGHTSPATRTSPAEVPSVLPPCVNANPIPPAYPQPPPHPVPHESATP